MEIVRYRLKPLSSFITDWSSDTLFGCLAWALVNLEGEAALHTLLEACAAGAPPFVLSGAFPGDLLPRPLIPVPMARKETFGLEDIALAKRQKKVGWLPLASFETARRGEPYNIPLSPPPFVTEGVLHNQINRIWESTSRNQPDQDAQRNEAGGHLYSVEETWLDTRYYAYLTLYALVQPDWLARLDALLNEAGRYGIGGRASTGKGTFIVSREKGFCGFAPVSAANGYIVLGNYVPAAEEGTQGFYKTRIKRGRLGQERSNWANAFKNPVVFLVAGSAFYGRPERSFVGRLVPDVAPGAPDVVQCGMTMALPARLPAKTA